MSKHNYFHGDTLVEVMFAIGLLSVIIVGTVLIMNGGTSKVQNSLEITMTRNEIDAEAEALRYIQSSYISERDLADSSQTYSTLWNDIKNLAVNKNSITEAKLKEILDYNPSTCAELYKSSGQAMKYGFVINYHKLNKIDVAAYKSNKNNGVLLTGSKNSSIFKATQTYPRMLFNSTDDIYTGTNIYPDLSAAEGLYVVAVKDTGTTTSVSDTSANTNKVSAFIDFYIRSCWQSSASSAPTLTSTVIRLYDPDISVVNYDMTTFELIYDPNGGSPTPEVQSAKEKKSSHIFNITSTLPTRNKVKAMGWAEQSWKDGDTCNSIYAPKSLSSKNNTYSVSASSPIVTLKAVYPCPYTISFYSDGKVFHTANSGAVDKNPYQFKLNDYPKPSKSNYTFIGWSTKSNATVPDCYISTTCYSPSLTAPHNTNTTLYAVWHPNYVINYSANGGSYPPDATICTSETSPKSCKITSELPTRSGYKFQGWATSASSKTVSYAPGSNISMSVSNPIITLYAVWKEQNEKITIKLTWGSSPSDLDAHVYGQKSNGNYFHAYYSEKVGSDVSGITIAALDVDDTTGYGPETFTINTLGGRNYYYYVNNFSGGSSITNATVTVSGDSFGTIKYEASEATGSGRYWNVFAYKDGKIIYRGTRSSSEDTSY